MKKQQRICPVHFDEANYFDYDYVDYKCSQCYNSNPTVRSRDDVTELQFRKFQGIQGFTDKAILTNAPAIPAILIFKQSIKETFTRIKQVIIDYIDDYGATLEAQLTKLDDNPDLIKLQQDEMS